MNDEEVKKAALAVAECVNVIDGYFNGGGLFSLLAILKPSAILKGLDKALFLEQLKAMGPAARADVDSAFDGALVLKNKLQESKVEELLDLAVEVVNLVDKEMAVVVEATALYQKIVAAVKA